MQMCDPSIDANTPGNEFDEAMYITELWDGQIITFRAISVRILQQYREM